MVGIVIVLLLMVWQVTQSSAMLGLDLKPDLKAADNIALNLAIRLFAWILTGVLVYMLMYGKSSQKERPASTKSIGLALSAVNILVWTGVTIWYFMNIHGK